MLRTRARAGRSFSDAEFSVSKFNLVAEIDPPCGTVILTERASSAIVVKTRCPSWFNVLEIYPSGRFTDPSACLFLLVVLLKAIRTFSIVVCCALAPDDVVDTSDVDAEVVDTGEVETEEVDADTGVVGALGVETEEVDADDPELVVDLTLVDRDLVVEDLGVVVGATVADLELVELETAPDVVPASRVVEVEDKRDVVPGLLLDLDVVGRRVVVLVVTGDAAILQSLS